MQLTHPDKILYEEDDITKLDIATYYMDVADWILPYIINRPLTLVRCPETYKKPFYQKHLTPSMPDHIYDIDDNYIYIKNKLGLLGLVQMGVLEIHPWGSKNNSLSKPDLIIFDIDPSPEVPWKKIVTAAIEVRDHLAQIKLESFVRTTGGKGLHVVVPVKPKHEWKVVKQFAKSLVDYLVQNNPKQYIGKANKAERKNKIYLDYLRNDKGSTAIASYSTRAREHAPIATPLEWEELESKKPIQYTIKTIMERLDSLKSDPWARYFIIKQSLK